MSSAGFWRDVDPAALPAGDGTPASVYERGVALVAAVDAARDGSDPKPTDDLDDPWGRGDVWFKRTADEIEATLEPFVALLLPTHSSGDNGVVDRQHVT